LNLKRTPLYPVYAQWGSPKLIDFGGWELPVQFSGIQQEHAAVREKAGLFDVSHMGEFRVEGPDAEAFLQRMTTNNVRQLAEGKCQYSLMCYPDGGVVDDLLIYRLAPDRFMLVVNAANTDKDWEWLQQHAVGNVTFRNISDETALIALQGPASAEILRDMGLASITELGSFRFASVKLDGGAECLVSRTGYTGEDGFEFYIPAERAVWLWERLLKSGERHGLVPAGLGARDTLRFEACLPLYGQELSPSISPLEAGLGSFVKLSKDAEFIGKEALAKQKAEGVPRRIVGIEMLERGIPRSHYEVFNARGDRIGEVTTGTQSPTLKKNIGLALVAAEYADLGTRLYVDIRGKRLLAEVVPTPFVKKSRGGKP
jgi:aminomethyltransferase